MDFFAVEVLTPRGLVRYLALIVIHLKTRKKIELAGLSHAFDGPAVVIMPRGITRDLVALSAMVRRPRALGACTVGSGCMDCSTTTIERPRELPLLLRDRLLGHYGIALSGVRSSWETVV